MNKKLYIVPDVHGRTFWKQVEPFIPENKVVFLGDYFDPYSGQEGIAKDIYDNFNQISELKMKYPDNVVLLIGNHDRHYMEDCLLEYSRFSFSMKYEVKRKNIFHEDDPSFMQIAYEYEVNNKKFLFTHAGVAKDWAKEWIDTKDYNAEALNSLYFNSGENYDPHYPFDGISSYTRGGLHPFGSPIWNDVRDLSEKDKTDYIQIFGHTQLANKPICVCNSMYCLDCRRPFYIDEQGELKEMDGTPIKVENI